MFRPRYNINDYARSYKCKIYGDMSRDLRSRSRRRRSGESKRRLRFTVYTEVGRGKDSKETRDSRLSEAKRGCRTAVFHGRFGSDVDRDDKRERRTVTGRREKERSLLTPHLPFSWSVFKVFYFQRDVRGWKTKGMGWQIKEQRKLHSERILSLSLPPLPPFFALSPLFSLLLCLLSLQRFSSRSHRTFSPDSVSPRPPRRLSFCRHSPRIDNILAGKKDRFLHKPEKRKKRERGKIAKQDKREKRIRSFHVSFIRRLSHLSIFSRPRNSQTSFPVILII